MYLHQLYLGCTVRSSRKLLENVEENANSCPLSKGLGRYFLGERIRPSIYKGQGHARRTPHLHTLIRTVSLFNFTKQRRTGERKIRHFKIFASLYEVCRYPVSKNTTEILSHAIDLEIIENGEKAVEDEGLEKRSNFQNNSYQSEYGQASL